MNINRNSFHYKWYSWTHRFHSLPVPHKTDLCSYTQWLLWGTLGCLISTCVKVVFTFVYYLVLTPIALLFSHRPVWIWNISVLDGGEIFVAFDGGKMYKYILFPAVFTIFVASITYFQYHSWHHSRGILLIMDTMASTVLILFAINYSKEKTEIGRLASAWLSARKHRLCPVVEFSDQPTTSKVDE